jgi:1,4-alpha-glucan branching enzyme
VALVGDFNQWNPARHRLQRDGRSSRWVITVSLPAGLHKYAFIVNDSVWTTDPSAVRTVDRDFGVTSSLVLVQ